MLNKLLYYYNNLNSDNFSILVNYGDLSEYSYDQLSNILLKWNKILLQGGEHFDVEWYDKNTRIKIRFNNSNRKFIKIIEEEWKLFNIVFER